MGDHRASIKIEAEMHGVKRKIDMWINWCADYGYIDRRFIDFFLDWHDASMNKYHNEMAIAFEKENKHKIETEERAELARLKSKYGDD